MAKSEIRPELHLRMMGDWGVANFHTVCGWIAAGMHARTAPGSSYVVHTMGPVRTDMVRPVVDDVVDLGIATPIATVAMAMKGAGMYSQAYPGLRGIAALPHRDRLAMAIKGEVADKYGLDSFEAIAAEKPPLRIAAGMLSEGVTPVGFACERVLAGYGIAWSDVSRWGGEIIECDRPMQAVGLVAKGKADAVFFEGIMRWHALTDHHEMRYLPTDQRVLDDLAQYDFRSADLEPGDLRGVTGPIPCVDFSDWLITVRDDMPDDVARLIAQVVVEDRQMLERKYEGTPLAHSALRYPLEPAQMCKTDPVPLHPGAASYFEDLGVLT